jgi:hypothetical protein
MSSILFEVYDKRALTEPIEGLPMLDQDPIQRKMRDSARRWGGCLVEVTCTITSERPLVRTIISSRVIWVHTPKGKAPSAQDRISHKKLMGKIRRGL